MKMVPGPSSAAVLFLARLEQLCVGLDYPSCGTEHPVAPCWLRFAGRLPPSESQLLAALEEPWTPVTRESARDVLECVSAVEDWRTPNERARGRRFRALEAALRPLVDLAAYAVGHCTSEEPSEVYVIGRLETDEWVGISFTRLW